MKQCYAPAAPRDPRWWLLLETLCDATATEPDWRMAGELLDANPEFRRFYVAYAHDEAALLHVQNHAVRPLSGPHLASLATRPLSPSSGEGDGRPSPPN